MYLILCGCYAGLCSTRNSDLWCRLGLFQRPWFWLWPYCGSFCFLHGICLGCHTLLHSITLHDERFSGTLCRTISYCESSRSCLGTERFQGTSTTKCHWKEDWKKGRNFVLHVSFFLIFSLAILCSTRPFWGAM